MTANIRQALVDQKRQLDHLFTCVKLDASDPLHFLSVEEKGKERKPLTRWLTYCNDLDTLLESKELMEGETGLLNVFGTDDGCKNLKVIWNAVKTGFVGPKETVEGGPKYCQVLASVSGVKESYHNMKVLEIQDTTHPYFSFCRGLGLIQNCFRLFNLPYYLLQNF